MGGNCVAGATPQPGQRKLSCYTPNWRPLAVRSHAGCLRGRDLASRPAQFGACTQGITIPPDDLGKITAELWQRTSHRILGPYQRLTEAATFESNMKHNQMGAWARNTRFFYCPTSHLSILWASTELPQKRSRPNLVAMLHGARARRWCRNSSASAAAWKHWPTWFLQESPRKRLNGYEESLNMNPYHLAGHFLLWWLLITYIYMVYICIYI